MPSLLNFTGRPRSRGPNPALQEGYDSRFWGPSHYGGPRVTDEEAVEFTTVYRSKNIIASTLGGLPIHVFDDRDSERNHVETGVARLIAKSPNREDVRFTFWSGLIADHVWAGNAFIHVVKNADNDALGLWRLAPSRVEVGRLGAEFDFMKVYRIDSGTSAEKFEFDYSLGGEIIHVMGRPDDSGLKGFDPRRSLLRTLGLMKTADELAGATWQGNAVPPGILSSDQVLSTEIAQTMQTRWRERAAGNIAVLGQGLHFEKVNITPIEAQLLESRLFATQKVAEHFGIPGQFLGAMSKADSFASGLEELMKFFTSITLAHHYLPFEQAIDKHLFGGGPLYMRFGLGGLLRGTKLQQYEAMRLATGGAPWMVPNEARALDELPAVDGGDVLAMPLNMVAAGANGGESAVMLTPEQANAAGVLFRSGYTPAGIAAALGIPDIQHTGLLPITLKTEKEIVAGGDAVEDEPTADDDGDAAVKAAMGMLDGGLRTVCPDCNGFIGHNVRGTVRCPKCNQLKVFA